MVGFITLEDAKAHLVVEHDLDDAVIQRLIDAASKVAEARTGYVALTREEQFLFDRFGRQLELRLRPTDAESVAVAYLDGNGDNQPFTDVRVVTKNGTTRIVPAIGSAWPGTVCALGAVTVTANVGLGETEAAIAAATPENIRHAVRLCVGSWFEDREAGPIPDAAADLFDDIRARRV